MSQLGQNGNRTARCRLPVHPSMLNVRRIGRIVCQVFKTSGMVAAARRDRPRHALTCRPVVAERRRRRTAVNYPRHINTASDLSKTASAVIAFMTRVKPRSSP